MNNLNYVFAAYSVIFAAIFIYSWLMSSRQKNLDRKVEELKALLKESARH
jgi:CcmD family protein